jgi:cell division protein FtsL
MKKPVRRFKETIEFRTPIWNRIRSHPQFPVALLAAALLLIGSFHIWQRVRVLSLVTEVQELKQENRGLIDAATKLNTEIAGLSMSSRLCEVAAESLGLEPIKPDRIYTLSWDDGPIDRPDEFSLMLEAIERVTRYVPVFAPSEATAKDLKRIKFDEHDDRDGGK